MRMIELRILEGMSKGILEVFMVNLMRDEDWLWESTVYLQYRLQQYSRTYFIKIGNILLQGHSQD